MLPGCLVRGHRDAQDKMIGCGWFKISLFVVSFEVIFGWLLGSNFGAGFGTQSWGLFLTASISFVLGQGSSFGALRELILRKFVDHLLKIV